ncbi:hypothetical protein BDQ17DRAFT_1366745 [Cyathus striatus]|nr:hypothetical protein BDQ17DRAFT_1366745 [Cyathus striatus]
MFFTLTATDELATTVNDLTAGKYFQLAAFVMLIYDHILTFPDEVERIWKQRFSGATVLFLLNRYVTPLQFIVIIDAFHDPIWTKKFIRCKRFVVFEGASTVGLISVIMIFRIYALYSRNNKVLAGLMILLCAQITFSSIGISTGFPAPLPDGLVGCIFTGSSRIFPAIWVTPLATDFVIVLLTLWRTRTYFRYSQSAPTIHIFMRDGLLYFFAIFAANLLNTLLFFLAREDIKAVGASFSQMLTSTMVSRLVLNLRSAYVSSDLEYPSVTTDQYRIPSFVARTIDHLGTDISLDDDDYEPTERNIPLRRRMRQ